MFLGKDHLIRKNTCSICHHQLDGATQINGINKPKPGDVSLCIECGNIAIFGNDLELRQPTSEENQVLQKDHIIISAQAIIFATKKTH